MEQFIEEYGISILLIIVGGSVLGVFGVLLNYI